MKTRSVLGWSYTVILCGSYSLLLSIYVLLRFSDVQLPALLSWILLFSITSSLLLLTVLITLSHWLRKHGVDPNGRYRLACLILLTVPFGWILTDVRPIENDYTMDDVVSNDPEVLKSYEQFMLLVSRDKGVKVDTETLLSVSTKIAPPDCTNIVAYSTAILQAWDSMAEVRTVIEKLDSYPGITDLTPQTRLNIETPIQRYQTLKSLSLLYATYVRLKSAEGNTEEAARQLAKLHCVTRKVLPNSFRHIDKAIWSRMATIHIETASAILRDPQCTPETLKILETAFPPLSTEAISLRRVIIADYLFVKGLCEAHSSLTEILCVDPKPQDFFHKVASSLTDGLTFKKNLTIKVFRKNCDWFLKGVAIKQPLIRNEEFNMDDFFKKRPDLRNMGCYFLIRVATPNYWRLSENSVKAKVMSDLLAIEISDRLGQPMILDDYYLDVPYGRDKQTGYPFSVGPDMKSNTGDDIFLAQKIR